MFAEIMASMRWIVYRTTGSDHFVTCDNPVFVGTQEPKTKRYYYGGLDKPTVSIGLPLTRNLGLYADYQNGPSIDERTATQHDINGMNDRTITLAQRFVYSPTNSNIFKLEVEKDRGGTFELSPDNDYLKQIILKMRADLSPPNLPE